MNKMKENILELEEKLTLLETNNYPDVIGKIMLRNCLDILVDYSESDFEKQINRYLKLEIKYK